MSYPEQGRPASQNELTHLEKTPQMVEAGVAAFERWFRQLHLEGLLVGLPEVADVSDLSESMFSAMMSARPED